jgi:hypothetical protein
MDWIVVEVFALLAGLIVLWKFLGWALRVDNVTGRTHIAEETERWLRSLKGRKE